MTIDGIPSEINYLDQVKDTLTAHEPIKDDHIKRELVALGKCFSGYSSSIGYISDTLFSMSSDELNEVQMITDFETLSEKISCITDYSEAVVLMNRVIYFQYKLNIIRDCEKKELTLKQKQILEQYLKILDNQYLLKMKILKKNLVTSIGNLGCNTLFNKLPSSEV
jgi:hypothetical protein